MCFTGSKNFHKQLSNMDCCLQLSRLQLSRPLDDFFSFLSVIKPQTNTVLASESLHTIQVNLLSKGNEFIQTVKRLLATRTEIFDSNKTSANTQLWRILAPHEIQKQRAAEKATNKSRIIVLAPWVCSWAKVLILRLLHQLNLAL